MGKMKQIIEDNQEITRQDQIKCDKHRDIIERIRIRKLEARDRKIDAGIKAVEERFKATDERREAAYHG
jgi:hypothetical protein